MSELYAAMQLTFEVRNAANGGYGARAIGHAVFTQAESQGQLHENVLEAVELHFDEEPRRPGVLRLQMPDGAVVGLPVHRRTAA